jgi:hypothetical protein
MMQFPPSSTSIGDKPAKPYRFGKSLMQLSLPMRDTKIANPGNKRVTFTTIDDVRKMAQELLVALDKLGSYKYPLDIRRGIAKEVGDVVHAKESTIVKSSSRTYFFDIKNTQEGKPYLVITESRKKENTRASIMIFPEDADEFFAALEVMIRKI